MRAAGSWKIRKLPVARDESKDRGVLGPAHCCGQPAEAVKLWLAAACNRLHRNLLSSAGSGGGKGKQDFVFPGVFKNHFRALAMHKPGGWAIP